MKAAAASAGLDLAELARAWDRSDAILDLVAPDALLAQPIALRQPFIFYLGHLPAFAWSQLGRGVLRHGRAFDGFAELFARGIDPIGVDAYAPADAAAWPEPAAVLAYRDAIRQALRAETARVDDPSQAHALATALEHELMHQETLLYMVARLPLAQLRAPRRPPEPEAAGSWSASGPPSRVEVPAGRAILGADRQDLAFGWDNEFERHEVAVPGFSIDRTPVRNRDFLEFMAEGGYDRADLWTAAGWAWRRRQNVWHPPAWRQRDGAWLHRSLCEERRLQDVLDWPASVSWAEAAAYARWRGGRLPSEPELHRAAYDTPEGGTRAFPWGDRPPDGTRGNFGFRRWTPTAVGSHPAGASAWGVEELVGNGWEWTASPFAPLPGFTPMPNYPGYSADFFDGAHYVLLGASWATADRLVRRSFRNWFQPHYPYPFSKFRLVHPQP